MRDFSPTTLLAGLPETRNFLKIAICLLLRQAVIDGKYTFSSAVSTSSCISFVFPACVLAGCGIYLTLLSYPLVFVLLGFVHCVSSPFLLSVYCPRGVVAAAWDKELLHYGIIILRCNHCHCPFSSRITASLLLYPHLSSLTYHAHIILYNLFPSLITSSHLL